MRQENELQSIEDYGFWKRRYAGQVLLWSAVYVMITRQVSWSKAVSTIDAEYYTKCLNTGKANLLYRPADPMTTEIGPQRRIKEEFDWWLVILIAIVLRWIYKKIKK